MKAPAAGLIAAAGASRRMGTAKALLHLGGKTILERLIDAYAEARLDPIVVVASGEALDAARARDVVAVEGDPAAPMIDSLARGIEALDESTIAAVIQPVDAPFTTAEMIALLLAGGTSARVLCHRGKAGHPVLVPRSLFEAIGVRPEGGLRALLAGTEVELVEWPDASVLADVDTPEDLAHWRARGARSLH